MWLNDTTKEHKLNVKNWFNLTFVTHYHCLKLLCFSMNSLIHCFQFICVTLREIAYARLWGGSEIVFSFLDVSSSHLECIGEERDNQMEQRVIVTKPRHAL